MKPMVIIPPGQMSQKDIAELRSNGICVVVTKDPARVKFVEALPELAQRGKVENAAIQLSRIILNGQWGAYTNSGQIDRATAAKIFVDVLTEGTPLDRAGTVAEREKKIYDAERAEEIKRIAREDARAERAKKKTAEPPKEDK